MTTINFETVECCNCGIVFQVPEDFDANRQEDGQSFWCPNGHRQNYVDCTDDKLAKLESEAVELRRQIRQLKCKLLGRSTLLERLKNWWRSL